MDIRRTKSEKKDGVDREEGVAPSIIDFDLSPPEAPDVKQAV